jgi:hypothetical protein
VDAIVSLVSIDAHIPKLDIIHRVLRSAHRSCAMHTDWWSATAMGTHREKGFWLKAMRADSVPQRAESVAQHGAHESS